MAKLTLEDVARYAKTMETKDILQNKDMLDYTEELQRVGIDVISSLSTDELSVAVSIMEAAFTSQMIEDNPMLAFVLLDKSKEFGIAMGQALKVAIGVVLSEGWR